LWHSHQSKDVEKTFKIFRFVSAKELIRSSERYESNLKIATRSLFSTIKSRRTKKHTHSLEHLEQLGVREVSRPRLLRETRRHQRLCDNMKLVVLSLFVSVLCSVPGFIHGQIPAGSGAVDTTTTSTTTMMTSSTTTSIAITTTTSHTTTTSSPTTTTSSPTTTTTSPTTTTSSPTTTTSSPTTTTSS
ncbi:hypothetical protein LSAT2_023348, partial [Lamellibrachia satsuma]